MANSDNPNPPADRQDQPKPADDAPHSFWMADLAKSAANSAIADPLRGLAQVGDSIFGTHADQTLKSAFSSVGIEAPQQATFGTANWYAQQIGGGIGMMVPFMGTRRLIMGKAFGESTLANQAAGFMSKDMLNYAGKEAFLSGASGAFYGSVLSSSDEKNVGTWNFVTDRLGKGASDGTTFALIGMTNPYMMRGFSAAAGAVSRPLSDTILADSLPLSESMLDKLDTFSDKLMPAQKLLAGALRGPLLPGVLSGVPVGAINAEVGAIKDGRLVATGEEFKESIVGNAIVGGAFGVAHRLTGPKPNTVDWNNEKLMRMMKTLRMEHGFEGGNWFINDSFDHELPFPMYDRFGDEWVGRRHGPPPEPPKPEPPPPLLEARPEHQAAVAELHPTMTKTVADHLVQGVSYAFPDNVEQQVAAIKNVDAGVYARNLEKLGATDEINTRIATEAYRFTGVFADHDLESVKKISSPFKYLEAGHQVPDWLPVNPDINLRPLGDWLLANHEDLGWDGGKTVSKNWQTMSDDIKALPPKQVVKLAEMIETFDHYNYNPYIAEKTKDEEIAKAGLRPQSTEMVNVGLGQIESLTHRQRQALVAAEYYQPGTLRALAQIEQANPGTAQTAARALELQARLPLADAIDIGGRSALERAAMQMSFTPHNPGSGAIALMNEALAKGDQYVWANNPNLELAIEQANPDLSREQRKALQETYGVVSKSRKGSTFYGLDSATKVAQESEIAVADMMKLDGKAFTDALSYLDFSNRNTSHVRDGSINQEYHHLRLYSGDRHSDAFSQRYESNTRMSALEAARGAYRLAAMFGDRWQEAVQAFDWKQPTEEKEGRINSDHWINQNVPIARPAEMRTLGDWMLDHKEETLGADQVSRIAKHWFYLNKEFRSLPTEKLLEHIDTIDTYLHAVSEQSGRDDLNNEYGYSAMNLGHGELKPGEVLTLKRALKEQQLMMRLDALVTKGDVEIPLPTLEELKRAIPTWEINPYIPIEIATKTDIPAWVASAMRPERHKQVAQAAEGESKTKDAKKPRTYYEGLDRRSWLTNNQAEIAGIQAEGREAFLANNTLEALAAVREHQSTLDDASQTLIAATAARAIKDVRQQGAHIATMNGQLFTEAVDHLDKPRNELASQFNEKRLPSDVYFNNTDMAMAPSAFNLALKLSTIFADQPAGAWKTWVDTLRKREFDKATAEENPKAKHIYETSVSAINDALPMAPKGEVAGLADWLVANSNFTPEQFGPVATNWTKLSDPVRYLPPAELVRQMQILESQLKGSGNPFWSAGQETDRGRKFGTTLRTNITAHDAGLLVINNRYGNIPLSDQKVLHAVASVSPDVLSTAKRSDVLSAVRGWMIDPTFPIEIAQKVASMDTQAERVAARIAWDQFKTDDLERDKSGNVSAETLAKFNDAYAAVLQKGARDIGAHAKDMLEAVQIFHPQLSEADQLLLTRALLTHRLSHSEDAGVVQSINSGWFQTALDDLDSGGFFDQLRKLHTEPRKLNMELVAEGRRIDPTFPVEIAIQVAKLPTPEHQEAARLAWVNLKTEMPELEGTEKLPQAAKDAMKRQFLQIRKTLGDGQDLTAGSFEQRKFNSGVNADLLGRVSAALDLPRDRTAGLLVPFNVDLIERTLSSFDAGTATNNSLRHRAQKALESDNAMTTNELLGNLNDRSNWQHSAALGLASTTGERTPLWLIEMSKKGVNTHDASEWLPVNMPERIQGLDDWLFDPRHFGRAKDKAIPLTFRKIDKDGTPVKQTENVTGMQALRVVAQRWPGLNAKDRALPFDKIVVRSMSNAYNNVEHQDFADMSSAVGIVPGSREGQFEFNQRRFLASQDTPSPFPIVPAEKSTWQSGDLVGIFLPRSDVRGVYLGSLLGCCQHPTGHAKNTAWYGQESPNGGFFAVVKKDNPFKVIAGSLAMVSPDGGMLIDSIEGSQAHGASGKGVTPDYRTDVANIYDQMAKDAVKEKFHTVTAARAGNAGIDFSRWTEATKDQALALATDFSAYHDARDDNQSILAQNPNITKTKPPEIPYIRGATLQDREAAQKIAEAVYPEGERMVPHGDFGYILNDAKGEPIGYAILDLSNHKVQDIAVLKEGRGAPSKLLLDAIRQKLQQIGGEWSADVRGSTSLKLLKYLAAKKVIKFTTDPDKAEPIRYMEHSDKGAEKDPVYTLYFKAWEPDATDAATEAPQQEVTAPAVVSQAFQNQPVQN